MIYDIAMGAFIALVLFDLVNFLAKAIVDKVQRRRRAEQLREFIESLEDNIQRKPRKKAVVKKKAVAKRK